MSERTEAFKQWIDKAAPGQVYTYYTGYLVTDRGTILEGIGDGPDLVIPNGDIHELGTLAIDAFEANKVHLFQRKLRDSEYEYIAMKRSKYGRVW